MAKSTDRRRSAEIRPLLVRAAAEEFAEKGFAGATVTDIASRAGVAPSVLYRHFSSKAEIFKSAVISPLLAALDEFREVWSAQRVRPFPAAQLWLVFIDDLYRSFSRHRHGLTAFIGAADQLDPAVISEIQAAMNTLFRELSSIGEEEAQRRNVPVTDVDLMIRLVVTLVAGATTLGPLTLAAPDGGVDEGRLVSGISDMTRFGLSMSAGTVSSRDSRQSSRAQAMRGHPIDRGSP